MFCALKRQTMGDYIHLNPAKVVSVEDAGNKGYSVVRLDNGAWHTVEGDRVAVTVRLAETALAWSR